MKEAAEAPEKEVKEEHESEWNGNNSLFYFLDENFCWCNYLCCCFNFSIYFLDSQLTLEFQVTSQIVFVKFGTASTSKICQIQTFCQF